MRMGSGVHYLVFYLDDLLHLVCKMRNKDQKYPYHMVNWLLASVSNIFQVRCDNQ